MTVQGNDLWVTCVSSAATFKLVAIQKYCYSRKSLSSNVKDDNKEEKIKPFPSPEEKLKGKRVRLEQIFKFWLGFEFYVSEKVTEFSGYFYVGVTCVVIFSV